MPELIYKYLVLSLLFTIVKLLMVTIDELRKLNGNEPKKETQWKWEKWK